tara:strand:+ start:63 stop:512 length:450 start_codon:yes stop_codon:yes gene_type:complete
MWENILKRRPLNINLPYAEKTTDASLRDIKNKIKEFLIKKEIMRQYIIDLGDRGEDLDRTLEDYFYDTKRGQKAAHKTLDIREKVQNGKISLLIMLRQLKRQFNSLRKEYLLREDLIASANIIEEIDNILSRDMYVLIDQDRPFVVERV